MLSRSCVTCPCAARPARPRLMPRARNARHGLDTSTPRPPARPARPPTSPCTPIAAGAPTDDESSVCWRATMAPSVHEASKLRRRAVDAMPRPTTPQAQARLGPRSAGASSAGRCPKTRNRGASAARERRVFKRRAVHIACGTPSGAHDRAARATRGMRRASRCRTTATPLLSPARARDLAAGAPDSHLAGVRRRWLPAQSAAPCRRHLWTPALNPSCGHPASRRRSDLWDARLGEKARSGSTCERPACSAPGSMLEPRLMHSGALRMTRLFPWRKPDAARTAPPNRDAQRQDVPTL